MFKQTLIYVFILTTCGISTSLFGQKAVTIKLDNPSFEDYPQAAHVPQGWNDCGFAGESAPDTHPNKIFGVTQTAQDGETFMGLVVRDNEHYEAVGQRLVAPLSKDIKYSFSVYACQSDIYMSKSQITGKDANYTVPVVLKIWGGNGYCDKKQLLAQSQPIDFKDWKKLEFTLSPKSNYRYIMIEAFYIKVLKFVYNGNVLIDNASAIVPILEKND